MSGRSENIRFNVYLNDKQAGATTSNMYKQARVLRSELGRLTIGSKEWIAKMNELQYVEKNIKRVRGEINNTNSIMSRLKTTASQIGPALGLAFGFSTLSKLFKGAAADIRDFQTNLNELSAITGAKGDDLDFLKRRAIELSTETDAAGNKINMAATDILNAFKLVGSAKPELLENGAALAEVTKQAIILKQAAGGSMALEDSVKALTTTMNQFNAGAEETERYINVLAAGSKYGAGDVNYLADAMKQAGTVSNGAGIEIEKTAAILELFAEKGIESSKAGTGFRNIIIEMQKDTSNYTNGVFDLEKAFDNLESIQGDTVKLTKIYGKESVVAAQILAQNRKRVDELTDSLTGTNTAYEQSQTNMQGLSEALKGIKNAWTSLILSFESGDGFLSRFTTKLVGGLTDIIKMATDANKSIEDLRRSVNTNIFEEQVNEELQMYKERGETYLNSLETMIQADEKRLKTGTKNIEQLLLEKQIYGEVRSESQFMNDAEMEQMQERLQRNKDILLEVRRRIQTEKDAEKITNEPENDPVAVEMVNYDKLLQFINKTRHDIEMSTLSSHQREVEQVKIKYEKMYEEAEANAQLMAELKLLEQAEIDAIDEAHALKKEEQKAAFLQRMREMDYTDKEAELEANRMQFENMIALAEQYGIDSADLIERQLATEKEIKDKYLKQEKEAKEKQSQEDMQRNIAAAQANIDVFSSVIGNAMGMMDESSGAYKALAVFQATLNAFSAAISAYASTVVIPVTGPVLAPIAAGTALAFGLAQIAKIKGVQKEKTPKPTPRYEKGGIARGSKHKDGGIHMIDSQSGRKVGEMEDGEPYLILSGNTYKNNKHLIDELLHNSQYADGAPVEWGQPSATPMPDFGMLNQLAASYASGGITSTNIVNSNNTTQTTSQMQTTGMEQLLNQILGELQKDKGVIIDQDNQLALRDALKKIDLIEQSAGAGS